MLDMLTVSYAGQTRQPSEHFGSESVAASIRASISRFVSASIRWVSCRVEKRRKKRQNIIVSVWLIWPRVVFKACLPAVALDTRSSEDDHAMPCI